MQIPAFYDEQSVGKLIPAQTLEATTAGHDLGLPAASEDDPRTLLLLVDMQIDFVHEDGALSVPGAVDDTKRIVKWIYQNTDKITSIAASLDSHVPKQIFYPTWWVDGNSNHPDPYTAITTEDIEAETWRPLFEVDWSRDYVYKLAEQAKKVLMIWPYHTMIGTVGHALTPAIYEALAYFSAARQENIHFLQKGTIPKTEHYSMLEPEVKVDEHPNGTLNTDFMELIDQYDRIYIAGEAKSHCVLETVSSIMNYYQGQPQQIAKFNIFRDGMSSVQHPDIDFEALAESTFQSYQDQGLNLINIDD